jgi:hypothetical protein
VTRGLRLPALIRCDNGPEILSQTFVDWCQDHEVEIRYIQPGKPVQNAFIESFNSKLRDECLNEHFFFGLAEARHLIEAWRRDYNQLRPHSSLDALAPAEYANRQGGGPPEQAQGSADRPVLDRNLGRPIVRIVVHDDDFPHPILMDELVHGRPDRLLVVVGGQHDRDPLAGPVGGLRGYELRIPAMAAPALRPEPVRGMMVMPSEGSRPTALSFNAPTAAAAAAEATPLPRLDRCGATAGRADQFGGHGGYRICINSRASG